MNGPLPKDVSITVDLGGPLRLAAVAFALVGRHGLLDCLFWFVRDGN